jgi:hypothetical protein
MNQGHRTFACEVWAFAGDWDWTGTGGVLWEIPPVRRYRENAFGW